MLILTGDKVDRMDFEEATHRFHELETLLLQCQGIPEDNKLVVEYKALKRILEASPVE
jgi:hypothetical protein